jgi:GNAT superfamily N-acetyltransferase
MFIRPAKRSDADFLAWAILAATRSHLKRGWFDIALNQSEDACLAFVRCLTITATPSNWHYSRFLVVDDGADTVSALSAFRAREAYPLATTALVEVMKSLGVARTEAAAFWERAAYMFRCTIRPDNDSLLIDTLATLPSRRGMGFTAALLSHAIGAAASQDIGDAQVSLFIGNGRAERMYIQAGFRLRQERRDARFESIAGAPGMRQYLKCLVS